MVNIDLQKMRNLIKLAQVTNSNENDIQISPITYNPILYTSVDFNRA